MSFKPLNQYEVDANLLLEHFAQFKHKSVQQQLKESFQFEAKGNRNPIIHLIAWHILTKTWDCEYLLIDRKASILAPCNIHIYKAWLRAKSSLATIQTMARIDDTGYIVGNSMGLTGEKSKIKIDRDDLPESKLTVEGCSDYTGTSYKNTRQGSYMGRKTK